MSGAYQQLTAFLRDVKALEEMAGRYPANTRLGQTVAAAKAAFVDHFATLDDFFGWGVSSPIDPDVIAALESARKAMTNERHFTPRKGMEAAYDQVDAILKRVPS